LSRYLKRRAATYLLVLAVALSLNFLLPRSIPGNPIEELSSGLGNLPVLVDPKTLQALQSYYGLDKPLLQQFWSYLEGLTRGDLGYSISYRAPVSQVLVNRFPWTLLLTVSSLLLSFSAALLLGSRWAGSQVGEWRVLLPAVLLESVPSFVLGSLLLILLGVKLPLFPLSGAYSTLSEATGLLRLLDVIHHAAMPVLVLSTSSFFSAYLVVRSSVLLVKHEPYVLMAKIKGLPEKTIRYHYVLRTALLPVVTFFGLRLAYSAGGAILVEVVFSYPGVGRLIYEAVMSHDYALLQGAFLIFTGWVVLINFATDCLYFSLDPRVKEV
jgi:peptide/nickel transport system permease protein